MYFLHRDVPPIRRVSFQGPLSNIIKQGIQFHMVGLSLQTFPFPPPPPPPNHIIFTDLMWKLIMYRLYCFEYG